MWTETNEGRELVTELSKDIVTDVSPKELPLFDELIDAFYDDPSPPDASKRTGDDPLAFGLQDALIAATPAAAAMATAVLNYIVTETIDAFQEESAEAIKKKIRERFRGKQQNAVSVDPLSKDQLAQIRKLARKQAKVFGIESIQASKMADALVGSLALAS